HFFRRKMKHRGETPSFGGTRHVLGSCWLWRRSLRAAMNHCDGFDAARCQATASRRFFTGVGPTSGLTRLRLIVGPFREADREARQAVSSAATLGMMSDTPQSLKFAHVVEL